MIIENKKKREKQIQHNTTQVKLDSAIVFIFASWDNKVTLQNSDKGNAELGKLIDK